MKASYPPHPVRAMSIEPADERILRAKYLDWCSARVADRFLAMTPDQIYDLAQESLRRDSGPAVEAEGEAAGAGQAAMGAGEGGPTPSQGQDPGSPSRGDGGAYGTVSSRELVGRVTEILAARVGLPTFEAWLAEYERSPEQFEAELLGLWKKRA